MDTTKRTNHNRIIVIGANGYIGSHVVSELYRGDYSIVAVDITESIFPLGIEYIQASVFEDNDVIPSIICDSDICIDLAWRNGFIHEADTHIQDLWGHYRFVEKMIDCGLRHYVGMGTMHEVGYWEGCISENTPCNPTSKYGIAKNTLRQLTCEMCKRREVVFQWLRGFYLIGDDVKNHSIFAKILQAENDGQKLFPFTSGNNFYDFLQIEDMAKYIVAASTQEKEVGIINCCSGRPTMLREMVENFICENELNIKLDYGKYPDRPYDSPIVYGDDSKIKKIMLEEI